MNNIGRIVFGCIAAVIIIAAIILLIPFGMSAENAKKVADDAFAQAWRRRVPVPSTCRLIRSTTHCIFTTQ